MTRAAWLVFIFPVAVAAGFVITYTLITLLRGPRR